MPHARLTDPETSHEAAQSVKNLTATKRTILWLFGKFKYLTDETLQAHYRRLIMTGDAPRASESGIRSRRAELVKAGYLFDSGQRKPMESGRNAIVWGVVSDWKGLFTTGEAK